MANTNTAFGLRPSRYLSGQPYNGACNTYIAPSSYGTDLFIGDPVVVTGAASVATDDGMIYPEINRITFGATNQITGVIVGFVPDNNIVTNRYGKASTYRKVLVADDPALLFEVQEDAVGGAIANASIGLNAQLIAGSGSTYNLVSGCLLDSSTAAADATYQVTIRNLVPRIGNEAATAYAKYLVSINLHTNRYGAVAGI